LRFLAEEMLLSRLLAEEKLSSRFLTGSASVTLLPSASISNPVEAREAFSPKCSSGDSVIYVNVAGVPSFVPTPPSMGRSFDGVVIASNVSFSFSWHSTAQASPSC